ncbi:hypothetical protein [Brevibacterium luteolum]|uniref:hypothetical protein n=1 Tax=Brevibacterium luteolum TaxID=199591 RepID=UPI00223B27E0|nr:hypothetical protein [Brevibacterium luteolum]MCT1658064.1 hypothetical protein [Brevibacterium luteolum]
MEASITVLIALVVLFAFTLPAILRRTDRAVAQRELSEVPETAEICQRPAAAEPCAEEPARPELFAASTPASRYAPPPGVEVVTEPAQLSLRRPAPALSVIDGGAEDTAAEVEADTAEAEYIELPLAAGETHTLTQLHTAAQTATLRDRRPDNHLDAMMTNTPDAGPSPTHRSRPAAMPAHLRRHLDTARTQAATGPRRPAAPGAGTGSHRARGGAPQAGSAHSARRPAPEIDGQTAEKIAGIRSIIPMVSVVFLGMLAATLVTAVLAAFSVVPWAVPLLTAVIAAGSVVLVGSLNKRVRTLRREATAPAARTARSYEPARGQQRPAEQPAQQRRTAEVVSARRAHAAEVLDSSEPRQPAEVPASSQARRFPRHILDIDETPAAEKEHDNSATEATAAAKPALEPVTVADADTEDLAEEESVEDQATDAAEDDADSNAENDTTVIVSRTTEAALSLSFGPKPARDTAETAEADAETEADAEDKDERAETVGTDPFAQRLQATGWKPSPLPKPTYVDAPVVERDQPEPVVADATSFTLEPQSKESLAEMFAAELGYRPELQDAARDEDAESGPLSHGRTAIRFKATGTDSGAGVASIDDVLARRRA